MLYTNYEHKLPNKEKFREDGLLEALCQVLSEDRDKEKGEIVGTLKKENNGFKKKGFKEVLLSHVQRNFSPRKNSLMYNATFSPRKFWKCLHYLFQGGEDAPLGVD